MSSIWNINNTTESTKETLDYINSQADELGKETGGAVLAKFIIRRSNRFETALLSTAATVNTRSLMGKNGEDASVLYRKQAYEFFVTDKDNKYELALFDLICNDEYPIHLQIEKTIAEEAVLPQEVDATSFKEFSDYFRRIVKTTKVNYIIRSLIRLSNIADHI